MLTIDGDKQEKSSNFNFFSDARKQNNVENRNNFAECQAFNYGIRPDSHYAGFFNKYFSE